MYGCRGRTMHVPVCYRYQHYHRDLLAGEWKVSHSYLPPAFKFSIKAEVRCAECPVTTLEEVSILEIFSRNNSKLHPFLSFPSH